MATQLPASTAVVAHGVTLPNGWQCVHCIRTSDDGSMELEVHGPVSGVADAVAAITTVHASAKWRATHSGASQLATVIATYNTKGSGSTEADYLVAPDDYSLQAQTVTVDLRAHPRFSASAAALLVIDEALARGDKAAALAAATAGAPADYLALRSAGINDYLVQGEVYTLTRHYVKDSEAKSYITALMPNQGTVYAWASVIGSAAAPFGEPKYRLKGASGASAEYSYQWQLQGVSIDGTGDEYTVRVTYQGAWGFASALYDGGNYTPALPS